MINDLTTHRFLGIIYVLMVCHTLLAMHSAPCLHFEWSGSNLTHWGQVTHICVSNLTIIGPDNGLSPGRRQAIIRTNAGILLIGPLGTNFSENLIEILTFSLMKMRLIVSSAKWRPFCLGLNVLISIGSGNGTNVDQILWCHMASQSHSE